MSIVIIGGNERMKHLYQKACQDHGGEAKVFTQPSEMMSRKMGSPDLVILFTGTVSHKMVVNALCEAKRCSANIVRCHSSSLSALQGILSEHCSVCEERDTCKERMKSKKKPS